MKFISALSLLILASSLASAREVKYDLTIAENSVNISGKPVEAMTINGGIPGPTLRFREGDVAIINVRNQMMHPSSIHWHGLLVPPDMDGVPFVSFPPIEPGSTFTYRFPIRQSGTYWYHSHTHLQEQVGVYGSIVIDPKSGGDGHRDHVLVLSDWSNRNPQEILRTLRRGSEYFSVEKKTAQSLLGAVKTGTLKDYFSREAMRMPAMDLSDVSYDAFIANGKKEDLFPAKSGETVRLRIINAAAASYFHLNYAGGPFTIVAADGQPVEPLKMNEPLFIAIAETYDVLVKLPSSGSYEFRATAQDGSGKTSLWLGSGQRHFAKDIPKPFLYESMMGFDLKRALALTPAGVMGMNDRRVERGELDQPGMNMGGMGSMQGMDHDMGSMKGMKMGGMNHQNMAQTDMKDMDMKGMDMSKDEGAMKGMDMGKDKGSMKGMDHDMSSMKGMDMSKDKGSMKGMDHDMGSMEGMDMSGNNGSMKGMDHDMGSMKGMGSMEGMAMGGIKENPHKWYDFLLREDSSMPTRLASDGMSPDRPFSPYKKLRALKNTEFPKDAPRRVFRLTLDGEMGRYVWMINNRPLSPSDDLLIKKGEVVKFVMINRTMMNHPMHLHGHFFRVLNGQGSRTPLKHTVNVEPMSTTVIEFMANEPGDWLFHCHILYHMMSGMARVVRYEGYTPDPATEAIGKGIYEEHNPFLIYGYTDLLSNMNQGRVTASSLLNIFSLEWQVGWHDVPDTEWEGTFTYERFINRFTNVFVGYHAEGVDWNREYDSLVAGGRYLLPGNFLASAWIDSEGEARVMLDRELMLTPRLGVFGEVEYDTRDDWSYQAGFSYLLTKSLSATALWDSDYGVGAGLTLRF